MAAETMDQARARAGRCPVCTSGRPTRSISGAKNLGTIFCCFAHKSEKCQRCPIALDQSFDKQDRRSQATAPAIVPSPLAIGGLSPMCLAGQPAAEPASAGEALSSIRAGFRYLNHADAASLTTAEQAECLRALGQAESMHTAARAKVLYAFTAQGRVRRRWSWQCADVAEVADPYRRRRGLCRGQVDAASGRSPGGRRCAGGGGDLRIVGAADL